MQKPVFKVDVVTSSHGDGYGGDYTTLDDVIPKSLSAACPHCGVYSSMKLDAVVERSSWEFDFVCSCPHCEETVFAKAKYHDEYFYGAEVDFEEREEVTSIFPFAQNVTLDENIPSLYRNDFEEAQLILPLSPKASAILSRRILQNVLREEYRIKHNSLAKEIDEFIGLSDIPSYLSEAVDAIRNVGNFAAHPSKDVNTGEIANVEPGEAGWLIEVLEALFDFTFVQPKRLEKRKKKLNNKLETLDKPQMKG